MTINPTLRAHMQMLQVEGRRNDIHKLTVLRSRFTRIFCDKICVPHTFYDFKTPQTIYKCILQKYAIFEENHKLPVL